MASVTQNSLPPPARSTVREDAQSTSTSSSTKRKRKTEFKFYSVRVGRRPGIYHSWPDCQLQINGFKDATFKSFSTLTEAEAFLNNKTPIKSPGTSSSPQKFYAVYSGRKPGVYTDWPTAQSQIVGFPKPRHKSFFTRAEAEDFVRTGRIGSVAEEASSQAVVNANATGEANAGPAFAPSDTIHMTPPKRQKKIKASIIDSSQQSNGHFEPGTGPLPSDAEDGFDNRIFLNPVTGKIQYKTDAQMNSMKYQPTAEAVTQTLRIYTDGSSLKNGTEGAIAGVGVFFGPGDTRNISEPLQGARQTNQRAELTAVLRALGLAPLHRSVKIYSDSSYAINCATVWAATWQRNGWMTSSKRPVENRDLVEPIIARIEERRRCGVTTEFSWLKGHANDPGNVAADALAVKGAREAKALKLADKVAQGEEVQSDPRPDEASGTGGRTAGTSAEDDYGDEIWE